MSSSSSSSSALSVRKADENNNAGRIDSAEDKRARLDSSGDEEQPAFASKVADADGAPAAPGAAERHHEDHVVGAHASAARDARRTISEAAAAVAAESDVDEAHHVAAARNARRRIGYKAKQEAAAKQKAAAQRSARNKRDRLRYKANTQARVAEQEAVSGAAPAVAPDANEAEAHQLARLARNQRDRIRYEANKQAKVAKRSARNERVSSIDTRCEPASAACAGTSVRADASVRDAVSAGGSSDLTVHVLLDLRHLLKQGGRQALSAFLRDPVEFYSLHQDSVNVVRARDAKFAHDVARLDGRVSEAETRNGSDPGRTTDAQLQQRRARVRADTHLVHQKAARLRARGRACDAAAKAGSCQQPAAAATPPPSSAAGRYAAHLQRARDARCVRRWSANDDADLHMWGLHRVLPPSWLRQHVLRLYCHVCEKQYLSKRQLKVRRRRPACVADAVRTSAHVSHRASCFAHRRLFFPPPCLPRGRPLPRRITSIVAAAGSAPWRSRAPVTSP